MVALSESSRGAHYRGGSRNSRLDFSIISREKSRLVLVSSRKFLISKVSIFLEAHFSDFSFLDFS